MFLVVAQMRLWASLPQYRPSARVGSFYVYVWDHPYTVTVRRTPFLADYPWLFLDQDPLILSWVGILSLECIDNLTRPNCRCDFRIDI